MKHQNIEWFLLSEMKVGPKYWLLDRNNLVGKGFLKNEIVIEHILKDCPEEFGVAVMCAEIKLLEVPE